MFKIQLIQKKYHSRLDLLDLSLLIAAAINKPREFVIAHPEFSVSKSQIKKIDNFIKRRLKHEPIAYILGQKEFFGLDFKVNKNTLIPRPETELLVEKILATKPQDQLIIDVGTGSGNIIISLAKNINRKNVFIGIDISRNALEIARKNAKNHKVNSKIKFIHGNLLRPILKKYSALHSPCSMIIAANLPYLSKEIYNSTPGDVKKYEPKPALFSKKEGLDHYEKLFQQIKQLKSSHYILNITCYLEISPEQKNKIIKLIKKYFSKSCLTFYKDLSGKWRICSVEL